MTFSAGLKLTDLNDFIQPSQVCIKPPSSAKEEKRNDPNYEVQIHPKKATVNLDDCLACSGCITSAESVLISSQSKEEIYKAIQAKKLGEFDRICVSVSPQSLASLAAKYGKSMAETERHVISFLKSVLAVDTVFDLYVAKTISLYETAREFCSKVDGQNDGKPLISSACPGWICYAEKVHPDLLPLISKVRSPQQIAAVLARKSILSSSSSSSVAAANVKYYHWTIMPCFDKKLEASRPDFATDQKKDVNCVISTRELEEMLIEHGWISSNTFYCYSSSESEVNSHYEIGSISSIGPFGSIGSISSFGSFGNSSGGYWLFLLHYWAQRICALSPSDYRIESKSVGKGTDFQEHCIKVVEGFAPSQHVKDLISKVKVASVYGFRNIQNIVRRLKKPVKNEYSFIEIMACPSGCINGGGQVKIAVTKETISMKKALTQKAEEIYQSTNSNDAIMSIICQTENHPLIKQFYNNK